MDNRPPGQSNAPERDVGMPMLERMLGVLDWDSLQAPGARASPGDPDVAEPSPDTRSHTFASDDRAARDAHRTPRASSYKSKQGGEGQSSERMQQMRARHREAQARYRAKHREQKSELEADIKRIKNSIDSGAGDLNRLRAQKASLMQRLSNATAALQATLEISKLLPVSLSHDGTVETLSLPGVSAPPSSASHLAPSIKGHVRANPSVIFRPMRPARPSPSSSAHHLPVSHEHILQVSAAAREPSDQASLASLQFPNPFSPTSTLPGSSSNASVSSTNLRSLLNQFQRTEAARLDAAPTEIAWYAQVAVEIAPGIRLSYSSTLMSPECVASNVLSGLLCRLEFALAARLQRLHNASANADVTGAPVEVRGDGGATSDRDSPTGASKRRRCDAITGLTASGSLTRSYGSHGSIPFVQGDTTHAALASLMAGGPALPPQSFATGAAGEDAAGTVTTGNVLLRLQQQRSRSLSLTKERMELMRVRCGVNGTHPMRSAVKAAYRSVVGKYAAPGRLPMHEITRVLEKLLEKEEIVLRSLWEAQVERSGQGAGAEGRSSDANATDALFGALMGGTGAPSTPWGSQQWTDPPARSSDSTNSWAPPADEQAFYESSSEHMIATMVSARAEMMRLLQELPPKAPSEAPMSAPVFDSVLQESLLATATAQAIGSTMAVQAATEVLLQLRIDSVLPLMSSLEFDTTHAELFKALGLSDQQKRALASGWVRWERGKHSLATLCAQATNFLNSLPHEVSLPPSFIRHLTSLSLDPVMSPSPAPTAAAAAAADANFPLELGSRPLPGQVSAPPSALPADVSANPLDAMAGPASRMQLLGGPSGQSGMTSDLQLQLLLQQHMQGSNTNLTDTLGPWPPLQLDSAGAAGQSSLLGNNPADENPFSAANIARSLGAPGSIPMGAPGGLNIGASYTARLRAFEDSSMMSSPHCHCGKSLAPGCFGMFSSDASQLNSGMQYIGQCSGHMSCAAQALQDLLSAHTADKEHLIDALSLQAPNAVLSVPQVIRVWSEHILEDCAPLDFLALCQLVSSQLHRQALFRHPFFHC